MPRAASCGAIAKGAPSSAQAATGLRANQISSSIDSSKRLFGHMPGSEGAPYNSVQDLGTGGIIAAAWEDSGVQDMGPFGRMTNAMLSAAGLNEVMLSGPPLPPSARAAATGACAAAAAAAGLQSVLDQSPTPTGIWCNPPGADGSSSMLHRPLDDTVLNKNLRVALGRQPTGDGCSDTVDATLGSLQDDWQMWAGATPCGKWHLHSMGGGGTSARAATAGWHMLQPHAGPEEYVGAADFTLGSSSVPHSILNKNLQVALGRKPAMDVDSDTATLHCTEASANTPVSSAAEVQGMPAVVGGGASTQAATCAIVHGMRLAILPMSPAASECEVAASVTDPAQMAAARVLLVASDLPSSYVHLVQRG